MAFILKNFLQVLKVGLLLNEQVHKPSAAAFLGVWGWEAPGIHPFPLPVSKEAPQPRWS